MVKDTVRLRQATVDDAGAIAPFHLRCWHAAYTGMVPQAFLDGLDRQDRVQRWRDRLRQEHDLTIVALDEDVVVALATAGPSGHSLPSPALELRSLYVGVEHQGTGLAEALVEATLAERPACLWVFAENSRARRFYDRTGWRSTGEQRVDPGTRVCELHLVRGEHLPPSMASARRSDASILSSSSRVTWPTS